MLELRKRINYVINMLHLRDLDFNLLFILFFLLGFGLLMVYSASSYVALRDWQDEAYFFSKQLRNDLIGLVGMILATVVPYKLYRKPFFVWGAFILSFAVIFLVIPFGIESHNATRWVRIPGIGMQFQPAELSKLCMIVFLASIACHLGAKLDTMAGAIFMILWCIPSCVLIYALTDNLSSAIIVCGISCVMVFIASRDYLKYLLAVGGVGALAAIVVTYVNKKGVQEGDSFRFARIYAWLHPELSSDKTAFQTLQGLYAIGNGGIWGKGLGQSVQKISKLPEPQNDMIFAVICEELGLIGSFALIIMFILLLYRMYLIARDTTDRFGFMIVIGVMAHIAIQVVLNIAVATNSMPNTGVSLPFISYGGTSVVFLLCEVGLVMNVDLRNKLGDGK